MLQSLLISLLVVVVYDFVRHPQEAKEFWSRLRRLFNRPGGAE